jgi:uncharacterized protein (DUF885 family)
MKIKTLVATVTAVLLTACGEPSTNEVKQITEVVESKAVNQVDKNKIFDEFKTRFLEEFWVINPGYAVYVGYYKHDDVLTIPDEASLAKEIAFETKIMAALEAFDINELSASNATDLEIIKNQVESAKWYREVFKSREWNPASYNVAGVFGVILNTEYKPLDERLRTIAKRLENIPAYYQAAVKNITRPTIEHTELAIQQNKGALGVFKSAIPNSLKLSTLSDEEKKSFEPKLAESIKSIENYVSWLEARLETIADGGAKDFRIGEALYEQKFKHDIVSNFTAKELYQKAVESKNELHTHMIEITKQLWPKYFEGVKMPEKPLVAVKQLIDHLSVKHVKREDFVNEVKRQMPIIEAYILENDLLEMDPTRPLVVRETPEYMRGFAGASVSAPGPYDATANTYYNVSPLDAYSEEQAESYLREYNHWILQILNIHEALPGHYTQLVHANKSPSMIKSIFGNGAMIEGWAVYSEKMMLESGYGGDNLAGPEPEMWLMYSKWNLRVVVNTILDYSIQVLGMSEEEGLNLLKNEAFQETTEAEGKWRRATLSQVQLTSYFNGFSEIYAFREELKAKMGDKFNLRDFHNKFLSYGNAPVPVIRNLMLAELASAKSL